ncbi:hypothetical protein ACX6XY_24990 [Streptomyces sp. O3]
MNHRIGLALQRTATRLLALLAPAKGRRRRSRTAMALATVTPRPPRTATGLRLLVRRIIPPSPPRQAGTPVTPAGQSTLDSPILDGPSPLVRPYLLAHEQHERRTALALALDGIDVGPWIIHGHPVGAPGRPGVAF